jgi:hypothetical protein
MARLFSVAMALLAGLLAVFLLDLALGATGTLAQEKENCPPGFFWERLSGTGCVQDRSTLPGHGKIGYDGTSICEDGYSGAYEHRETTDGETAPGTPYVNFAFLTACNGAAAAPAATTGGGGGGGIGGVARDAAEQLYDGGGGPSMGTLAGIGAGVTTFLAAASAIAVRWGGVGAGSVPGAAMPSASAPGTTPSSVERLADLAARQKELEDKLKWSRAKRRNAQARFLAVRKRLREVSVKYWRLWRQQKWALLRSMGVFNLGGQDSAALAGETLSDYALMEAQLSTSGTTRNKIKAVYAEAKVTLSEWNQQVRGLESSLKEVQTELRGHRKP